MKPEPSAEGSEATASATFSDPGKRGYLHLHGGLRRRLGGAQPGAVSGHTCTGPAHAYVDNGTYSVAVVVTDDDEGIGSNSANHQVDNVPPEITGLSLDSTTIPEGGTVALAGTFSDPGTSDGHEVTIDWGDGSKDSAVLAKGARDFAVSHRYLTTTPRARHRMCIRSASL